MIIDSKYLTLLRVIKLGLIILIFGCSGPKRPDNSYDNNQSIHVFLENSLSYELINYVIKDKLQNFQNEYSKCKYLLDKEPFTILSKEDSLRLLRLETIFSKNDLDTIFKQNIIAKSISLNAQLINSKITVISSDSLASFMNDSTDFWDSYYAKYGRNGFAIIAPPLFSKDRQTAIVKYSCQYHGLNGEFNTLIYKKINNEWTVIYVLDSAIS
jgi:hypothetical protein